MRAFPALLLAAACYPVPEDDDPAPDTGPGDPFHFGDGGSDGDGGEDGSDPEDDDAWATSPKPVVRWQEAHLELVLGDLPGEYYLGIAESFLECGEWCWTGEDCIYGWEDPDSGQSIGPFCHTVQPSLENILVYGGNCLALEQGTTCFPDDSFSHRVAYYLERYDPSTARTSCWIWGSQASSYYAGLGCTEL